MPISPSSSAQAAREAIAGRLRDIRKDAGLTGHELATRAGWHASKSSRIENARTPPSDEDVRTWCRVCGADDQADDLIAANRSADSMYVQWKRLQRTGSRRLQESRVPLYESTQQFRVYCSNVIPGLLQTEAYATALFALISRAQGTPDDSAEAAAARVARSKVIHKGEHRFALLVEESVLRYRIGDAETMAGQLGYLLTVMSLPSVSLGVIPFAASRSMWTLETFMIFDQEQVQVELLTAAVNIRAPGEVEQYAQAFTDLGELAVYGRQARALITSAIDAL
ncbi:helix-turn-helix domain-containing protein [Streptomyces hiroshimensis]|uniref:Transcriptional regulator n=1 Tax=Streptomyces hiroshimensis TaxID=66424 RepID=A0ABQ2Y546_9ACTN|nr:helix-turn-helix transcriptional regulator [Streptomyces hiroshimensis]GGX63114.1 transcriptional regulator [Streptomyces hiroshimensis]